MYREIIDNLIKTALLSDKRLDLKVLRLIKSEYQILSTTKDNKGNLNVLDNAQEVKILKKMQKQWKEEWQSFVNAHRTTEALELGAELSVLEALIPKEASVEEQKSLAKGVIEIYLKGLPIEDRQSMRHLVAIMKIIRTEYPAIDGKLVSEVYKEMIGL